MDSSPHTLADIEIEGALIAVDPAYRIASLRHFDRTGRFSTCLSEALGHSLPAPLRAARIEHSNGAHSMLAWRAPRETLLLCTDQGLFLGFANTLSAEDDGCMVDQSGGIRAIRATGTRAREILLRLGAESALPQPGQALTARLAELSVLTIGETAGSYLMLVERVYAHHLFAWIDATAADM